MLFHLYQIAGGILTVLLSFLWTFAILGTILYSLYKVLRGPSNLSRHEPPWEEYRDLFVTVSVIVLLMLLCWSCSRHHHYIGESYSWFEW